MAELFPAIRGCLAAHGIRLPRPYPHFSRTLIGSALAAVLAACLLVSGHLLYMAARITIRAAHTTTEISSGMLEKAGTAVTENIRASAAAVTAGTDVVENMVDLGMNATTDAAVRAVLALSESVTAGSDMMEELTDAGVGSVKKTGNRLVFGGSEAVTAGSRALESRLATLPELFRVWLVELLTPSPEVKAALERQRLEYERSRRNRESDRQEDMDAVQRGTLAPPLSDAFPPGQDPPPFSEVQKPEQEKALPSDEAYDEEQNREEAAWRKILVLPHWAVLSSVSLPEVFGNPDVWEKQLAFISRFPPLPFFVNPEQWKEWTAWTELIMFLHSAAAHSILTEDVREWLFMTNLPLPSSIVPLPPSAEDLRQWRIMAAIPPFTAFAFLPPSAEDVREWRFMAALLPAVYPMPLPPSAEDIRLWRIMAAVPSSVSLAPLPPALEDVRLWRVVGALPAPLSVAWLPPLPEEMRTWHSMSAAPPVLEVAPLPLLAEDLRLWRVVGALPAPLSVAWLPPSPEEMRAWHSMSAAPSVLEVAPLPLLAEDLRLWRVVGALPAPLSVAWLPPCAEDMQQWRVMFSIPDLPMLPPTVHEFQQWEQLAQRAVPPVDYGRPARLVPPDAVAEVREQMKPHTLPYLEKSDIPLSDIVKQTDFALFQTVARLHLEEGRIFILGTESRKREKEHYLFQRIKIYLPKLEQADARTVFAGLLASTLEVWSDRASLVRPLPHKAELVVNGLTTHELWLETVGEEFLLPPLEKGPRLTVVIDDMGANPNAVHELLDLDIPVTVSVWPRSRYARETAELVHMSGREVLVHQPMEPVQAPYVDAGPGAITSQTAPEDIRRIVAENLKLIPYASGLNNHMGSRFTQNPVLSGLVCDIVAEAGLFVLDSVTHPKTVFYDSALQRNIPAYRRDVFLDEGPRNVKSVLAKLREAEAVARRNGQAVAIGHPHPETLAALRQWCTARDSSIQIVPLRHLPRRAETFTPAEAGHGTPTMSGASGS